MITRDADAVRGDFEGTAKDWLDLGGADWLTPEAVPPCYAATWLKLQELLKHPLVPIAPVLFGRVWLLTPAGHPVAIDWDRRNDFLSLLTHSLEATRKARRESSRGLCLAK